MTAAVVAVRARGGGFGDRGAPRRGRRRRWPGRGDSGVGVDCWTTGIGVAAVAKRK